MFGTLKILTDSEEMYLLSVRGREEGSYQCRLELLIAWSWQFPEVPTTVLTDLLALLEDLGHPYESRTACTWIDSSHSRCPFGIP